MAVSSRRMDPAGPLGLAGALVLALLLSGGPAPAAACMCQSLHPQEQFCRAHFVILAKIVSESPGKGASAVGRESFLRKYEVGIKKIFKGAPDTRLRIKESGIEVPVQENLCGLRLEVGERYLLMGQVLDGQARVNMCDQPQPWKKVTVRQRKGVRLQYNCVCRPADCPWWGGSLKVERCLVDHSVCTKHRHDTCNWLRGRVLDRCLLEAGIKNVQGEHSWWGQPSPRPRLEPWAQRRTPRGPRTP